MIRTTKKCFYLKEILAYSFLVALFMCNTTSILHGSNTWMFVSSVCNWEIWNQFGESHFQPFFKAALNPGMMHM